MILNSKVLGSSKKKIIILHGFLGSLDNWITFSKKISENNFEVHLIDQRNHGRSFWSSDFSYPFMVEDLLVYMNHNQITSAILLGHSMGGKTAMNFALKYPKFVSHLIIADISPKYYGPHHQKILKGLVSLDFEVIQSRKDAEDQLSLYVTDFGTRQFLLKNLYRIEGCKFSLRINLDVLKNSGEAIGEAINSDKMFNNPTLFMIGANSGYVDKSFDYKMIVSFFPKAEILEIKEVGHWLHAEKPELFFNHLISWIN